MSAGNRYLTALLAAGSNHGNARRRLRACRYRLRRILLFAVLANQNIIAIRK